MGVQFSEVLKDSVLSIKLKINLKGKYKSNHMKEYSKSFLITKFYALTSNPTGVLNTSSCATNILNDSLLSVKQRLNF